MPKIENGGAVSANTAEASTKSEPYTIETKNVPSVQIVLLRHGERGPEVFLGHRTAGAFIGRWSFPGGVVDKEKDESDSEAACREGEEETGAAIKEEDLIPFRDTHSSVIRVKNGRKVRYNYRIKVFLAHADHLSPHNASPYEHDVMRWFQLDEALEMHDKAIQAGVAKGMDPKSDDIPGTITRRSLETIKMLTKMAL